MIEKALAILNLVKASAKTLAIIALGVVAAGVYLSSRSDKREAADAAAAKDKVFAEALARAVGAIRGEKVAEIKTAPALAPIIKAGGRAVAKTVTTATIVDETKAVPVLGTNDLKTGTPTKWCDDYHRFCADLVTRLFKRSQVFSLEQTFVRSPSGDLNMVNSALREFDPETKEEIPSAGVTMGGKYSYVEEKVPGPGPWHLYGVAAIDHRAAPGAGAQVEPKRHLTASLIGFYSPKDKDIQAALHLGWRPGAWTLAFGPKIGYSTGSLGAKPANPVKAGFTFGLAATIRLWGEPR